MRGEECIHNRQHGPHTIQHLPESGHSRSLSSDLHLARVEGSPQGMYSIFSCRESFHKKEVPIAMDAQHKSMGWRA